ncbi:hypothetical protein B0H11DRAFT_437351 [Mycena galericulata]|nr:hypothetical protein B0H11DRAFT_437351 [Mycena galericulata]
MSAIRWLLASIRRLLWGIRASLRGLLFLLSALSRATTRRPDPPTGSQTLRVVYPPANDYVNDTSYPNTLPPARDTAIYTSASFVPSSLHPYMHSGPSAFRSSQDITAHSITQESYPLQSLSVQHLPATLSVQRPPSSLSVQHLPALPPSPDVGPGYLPSANTSVIDINAAAETESPNQSPRSSRVLEAGAGTSVLPLLNDAHERIFPGTPESVRRYDRKVAVPNVPTQYTIPPLTISMRPVPPPEGWTACLHPEGTRYFFHEEKRVFTDANLYDAGSLEFITDNVRVILDFLLVHGVSLDAGVDLVVDEYEYSDMTKGCQYYFVNHKDRSVFWMDRVDSDMFLTRINGITSASHIRHELEAQYWYHCELFPRSVEITHEIVDELRDIVLHALGDLATSPTSTVVWNVAELERMINLIDGIENVDKGIGDKASGANCLVGRLMHMFVSARVYNFHGEPGARLNVEQSVYAEVRKWTPFISLLSPLLFYAPDFHLAGLHTVSTDKVIHRRSWSEFITRLSNEWQEFILYGTVMLNANVAFLSIQSVDQGGVAVPTRSAAQISSYLSTLTSIGAVIIGLLLVKQNRNRDFLTSAKAQLFTNRTWGLERLAVLHSLPYAMLIWSMVSFFAAFSLMCFEDADRVTRTLVAIVWAAVVALILWCVFTAWESGDWDFLRRLWYFGSGRAAAAEDKEEQQGEAGDEAEPESAGESEQCKPRRRRWAWPSITLRKGSSDSKRAVTDV